MPFKLVAGIPSYNEADTIEIVTRELDEGVQALPFWTETILANADNCSPDGTADLFRATPTRCRKAVLNVAERGKGANIRALMELALAEHADALLLIDADLAYVRSSWIQGLLEPLAAGRQAAFARRPPLWNRGDLTYQLCYPIVAAVFGADVHEPIAPTVAFSRTVLERAMAGLWPTSAYRYGIDLFLTSLALDMDWCEVVLEERLEHKLRSYGANPSEQLTAGTKFVEVLDVVRDLVVRRLARPMPRDMRKKQVGEVQFSYAPITVDVEHEALTQGTAVQLAAPRFLDGCLPPGLVEQVHAALHGPGGYRGLSWPAWQECLLEWLVRSSRDESRLPTSGHMEVLLLARVVGYYYEHIGRADWYATVEAQARQLFLARQRLWDAAR